MGYHEDKDKFAITTSLIATLPFVVLFILAMIRILVSL